MPQDITELSDDGSPPAKKTKAEVEPRTPQSQKQEVVENAVAKTKAKAKTVPKKKAKAKAKSPQKKKQKHQLMMMMQVKRVQSPLVLMSARSLLQRSQEPP